MVRIIMIMAGCLSLTMANLAQAQVIQAGTTYSGGGQLELPGSGASFTVPRGWFGQYDSRAKLFNMHAPNGQQITVGYKAQSYADAIAEAKQPITTSDGVVMHPDLSNIIRLQGRFRGKAFTYSGKALMFMNVGAVVLVIKMPSGKALTVSSGGMGQNYEAFGDTLGWVMPSLSFAGESRQPQRSSSTRQATVNQGVQNRQQASARGDGSITVAGISLLKVTKHTELPPPWLKLDYDPFKVAYRNRSLPPRVKRSRQGMGLYDLGTNYKRQIVGYYWVDPIKEKRLSFCFDKRRDYHLGHFAVSDKAKSSRVWQQTDMGRFTLYCAGEKECYASGSGGVDVIFLDRAQGEMSTSLIHDFVWSRPRSFWGHSLFIGGVKYTASGINESCPSVIKDPTDVALSKCEKSATSQKAAGICKGTTQPEVYTMGGKMRQEYIDSTTVHTSETRRGGSSSGSYDTHFGTTSDGKMIFSAPGVSGCAGC